MPEIETGQKLAGPLIGLLIHCSACHFCGVSFLLHSIGICFEFLLLYCFCAAFAK